MIKGFSKLSAKGKTTVLEKHVGHNAISKTLESAKLADTDLYKLIEGFSENVIGNFPFPYSVVPNVKINGKDYFVPMVTEESSVVAAVAKSAKFWYNMGGFKAQIVNNIKKGHVHFLWKGSADVLQKKFSEWKQELLMAAETINAKMKSRGGGLLDINLINKTSSLANFYQLEASFDTCNAMGANFMNSCLEGIANKFNNLLENEPGIDSNRLEIIMSILSNYSPESVVKCSTECTIEQLADYNIDFSPEKFAHKFQQAVNIARVDINRAVTHNKGIYNGVDAVALATGNDWRAIEANGHAYAAKYGAYQGLSKAIIKENIFYFELEIPLQVGVIGGVTTLHPMAKLSMQLLGQPNANELMKIIAAIGLASNFAAIKALVTSGIQKGHMKMHLGNMLKSLGANNTETKATMEFFKDKTVSFSEVRKFVFSLRG